MIEPRCRAVPLCPQTVGRKKLTSRTDLLQTVEAPALIRHGQHQNTTLRMQQFRGGTHEADRIWQVLDDVAGDQNVERPKPIGWKNVVQGTIFPDDIDPFDYWRR